MAATGEYIASACELAFLEPGSASNWFDLSQYVNNLQITSNTGEAETTTYGGVTRTFIPGLNENSISFTLMHNTVTAYAQQPQVRVRQLQQARTATTWRIRPRGTGSLMEEIQGSGFVTAKPSDLTLDDQPVTSECEVRISGAFTYSQQA